MYLQFDHPTLESKVREGLTKFCLQNKIQMPKNGDTVALAYQLLCQLRPYAMMYTYKVHITDDMFIQPTVIDDERYTCQWRVYKETDMTIDGHDVYTSVHVATFGWHTSGYQHEPAEFSQYCWKAVMNGNENSPTWEEMYHDREKFYVEFERQNIEKINAGR